MCSTSGLARSRAGTSLGASHALLTLTRVTAIPSTSSRRWPVMSEPSSSIVIAKARWPLATSALPRMASGHWRNCRVTPTVVTMATRNSEEPQCDIDQGQAQSAKPLLILAVYATKQLERDEENGGSQPNHYQGYGQSWRQVGQERQQRQSHYK